MRDLVRGFWQTHLSELQPIRIERFQFKEMRLAERLQELLLDTDPEIVAAIAEVGLPGTFSNSVAADIKTIAKEAQR